MRFVALILVGAACLPPTAMPAAVPASAPCTTAVSSSGEQMVFTCPLSAPSVGAKARFQANFAGGHDDTSASLTAALAGRPVECSTGSKTSLMGEFGAVSLHCDFELPSGEHVLEVELKFSHAEYVNYTLQ